MPKLQAYRALEPFTLEELVDAVNSVLRDRPRLVVSSRTVRYYVSQRVLPPPHGPSRVARYSFEHLAIMVAARCLQDKGESLEVVRESLQAMRTPDGFDTEAIQGLVDRAPQLDKGNLMDSLFPAEAIQSPPSVPAPAASPRLPAPPDLVTESVTRYRLTPHTVLEVSHVRDLAREIDRAIESLYLLRKKL